MYRIAIVHIATGKYIEFWDTFYTECERYFLPQYPKTYFIWTDANNFAHQHNANVVTIYQEQLDWPFPTLLRYHFFSAHKDALAKYDFIYFFNANISFLAPIGEEILPSEEQGLLVAIHPSFHKASRSRFTYERRTQSLAYIPLKEGKHYVLGGINGGRTSDYLLLIETLKKNIEEDLNNNIIALWHDESHLNKYILDKNPLTLSPPYILAENINGVTRKKLSRNTFKANMGGGVQAPHHRQIKSRI